jgi:endonuclease YncB( thermonuclease family)
LPVAGSHSILCVLLTASLLQAAPTRRYQEPTLVAEEVLQADVTSVEDGDSLVVKTVATGESMVVHIAGVDAPELSQPGGAEAKAFLGQLLTGKRVTVRLKRTIDRVARVEIGASDVSRRLIQSGMAWHCPRFAKEDDLAAAEAEARAAKRGLWSRAQPTPPWLHRGAGVCWQRQSTPAKSPSRPDFSGRWTAISPPDRAGHELTIVQDPHTLTIRHESDELPESLTYKLEGTTSRAFTTAQGPADSVAKSRWNDRVWTVDERQWLVHGHEPRTIRQRLWLDERGFLNVEMSSPQPIGEYDSTVVRYRRSVASREIEERSSLPGVNRGDLAAGDLESGRPPALEVAGQHPRIDQKDAVSEPGADGAGNLRRVTDDEASRAEAFQ